MISTNIFLQLFREKTSLEDLQLHEQEIRQLLQEGLNVGVIESNEHDMISNVFEINDISAKDVMAPRVNIKAQSIDAPQEEIEECVVNGNYSRIPIYKDNLDHIEGILHSKDYIRNMNKPNPLPFRSLLRRAHYVPESMKIDKILRELQSKKTYIAIVVDEYGGTAGLITMDDILEEIVGDIREMQEKVSEDIISLNETSYLIAGNCNIADFNEYFVELPISDSDSYTSVAGYVIDKVGRFPEVGEIVQTQHFEFELISRVRQKLVQFRVTKKRKSDSEQAAPIHQKNNSVAPNGHSKDLESKPESKLAFNKESIKQSKKNF